MTSIGSPATATVSKHDNLSRTTSSGRLVSSTFFVPKTSLPQKTLRNEDLLPLNPVVVSCQRLNLLDLPPEIFEKILSYLDFKTVTSLRIVSQVTANKHRHSNLPPSTSSGRLINATESKEFIVPTTSNLPQKTLRNEDLLPLNPSVVSCQSLNLLDLPPEIIEKILSYLDFKTVASLRIVNKRMDKICGSLLTSTCKKLQKYLKKRCESIKARMPRRESARQVHPLANEFDLVDSVRERIADLMSLSFGEAIKDKRMCFFPGEILDEAYRVLRRIKANSNIPWTYKETVELDDLITMADEHFEKKLKRNLPKVSSYPVKTRKSASHKRGKATLSRSQSQKLEDRMRWSSKCAKKRKLDTDSISTSTSIQVATTTTSVNKHTVTIGEDGETNFEITLAIKGTRTPEQIEKAKKIFCHLIDMDL